MSLLGWLIGSRDRICRDQLVACQAENLQLQAALDQDTAIIADLNKSVSSLTTELGLVKFSLNEAGLKIIELESAKRELELALAECQEPPPPPPPPPPPAPKMVLAASGPGTGDLGLAHRQYMAWTSIDGGPPRDRNGNPVLADTQLLTIKFAPATGWIKGQPALWKEIASGAEDARATAWSDFLKTLDRRIAVFLHHEPVDGKDGSKEGLASDLQAAVRRVSGLWKAAGVQHMLGQVLIAQMFKNNVQDALLAPDALDVIGCDGYAKDQPEWFTAEQVFFPFLAYCAGQGKPAVLFEVAIHDALPGEQKTFYESLDAYLKAQPSIVAAALYGSVTDAGDSRLNTEGLEVVTRMAADEFYGRAF